MTNRNDITRQVEELLGSDGSPEMAAALLPHLEDAGAITFDADRGYEMTESFDDEFAGALAAVIEVREIEWKWGPGNIPKSELITPAVDIPAQEDDIELGLPCREEVRHA